MFPIYCQELNDVAPGILKIESYLVVCLGYSLPDLFCTQFDGPFQSCQGVGIREAEVEDAASGVLFSVPTWCRGAGVRGVDELEQLEPDVVPCAQKAHAQLPDFFSVDL